MLMVASVLIDMEKRSGENWYSIETHNLDFLGSIPSPATILVVKAGSLVVKQQTELMESI